MTPTPTPTTILSAIVIMIIIDSIWLQLNKLSYAKAVQAVQKSNMQVNIRYAIITYAIMAVGMWMILTDVMHYKSIKIKVARAFVWGIIIYGVYNGTSAAIYSNYSIPVAIKDTIWGGILYGSTVFLVSYFKLY